MAYGKTSYGTFIYGDLPEPTKETIHLYKPDLMGYLPRYYDESTIMQSIQDASAEELGLVYYFLNDLEKQLFISTATWRLSIWENELGLPTDVSQTYEERREIILARLRGMGTTGKSVLISAASAFSGGDVDIDEYPAEYRFAIKFIGTLGVPKNMASFVNMVEDVKPAHLAYSFEYTFTWWNKIAELTWTQVGAGTWDDLRIYE